MHTPVSLKIVMGKLPNGVAQKLHRCNAETETKRTCRRSATWPHSDCGSLSLKRGTSTQIKPLFPNSLHWLEFMTLPRQAVYLACSRSPGCTCVLLLSAPHTLMPCTSVDKHVHMCAHTNTCAFFFKTMYQPAF